MGQTGDKEGEAMRQVNDREELVKSVDSEATDIELEKFRHCWE